MRRHAALAALACFFLCSAQASAATTPIEHLVVIVDEGVSFDHYFGLYPHAANQAGSPAFHPRAGTPSVNGLSPALLTSNPNSANPFRLPRTQAATCGNGSGYSAEQQAHDGGAMDKFVQFVSCANNTTMGYFDGNTVTALWNYAQHYAISDNYFQTVFGPSTPGALNLISGQTHGASPELPSAVVNGTVIGEPDPTGDQCGNRNPAQTASFGAAPNIGTLLSAKGVTWGWFQGGFRPTGSDAGGALCGSAHSNVAGTTVTDYLPRHDPFQYYNATRNPTHAAPASVAAIGHDDAPAAPVKVHHQYALGDFTAALDAGKLPAVSFLKAAAFEDGHAGYSDPLDEQHFLVRTINQIQASSAWGHTAIVIAYDGSGGWYDHQASPIVNSSSDATFDKLDGAGQCSGPGAPPTAGGYQLRCGFGPRTPLVVVSPYSRINHVDHTQLDQTSVLRFIEDNWATGRIGDFSFDDIPAAKATITPLLNFSAGAPRAARLALFPSTGTLAPRAAKAFTLNVKPKRDREKPFVFNLNGKLVPPAGAACSGVVTITARTKQREVKRRTTPLTKACAWSGRLKFAHKPGGGHLTIRASYGGNAAILPRKAPAVTVRAG
jgi:phospholipase C